MSKSKIPSSVGKHRLEELKSLRAALSSRDTDSQLDIVVVFDIADPRPVRLNAAEVVVCEGKIDWILERIVYMCGFSALVGVEAIDALWQSKPVVLMPLTGGGSVLVKGSTCSQLPERGKALTAEDFERLMKPWCEERSALKAENVDLKKAKEALEQMKAKDLFRFVQLIDAESFQICAAVLIHGNVHRAAKALKMKDSTVRSRIEAWGQRGPAYQQLSDFVRWRKKIKGELMAPDLGGLGHRSKTDYPAIYSEMIEQLLLITPETCIEVAEELIEKLENHSH